MAWWSARGASVKKFLIGGVAVLAALFALGWVAFQGVPIFENVTRLPGGEMQVALSFDDGPNPPHTDALLRLLAEQEIRATFFMTGQHIARHPEAARRVVLAGHHVGNHSWSEKRLALLSPTRVREALARTDALLREIGVVGPIDARAPGLAIGLPGAWVFWRTARRHIGGSVGGAGWTRGPVATTPPCPFWMPADFCPTQAPDIITARVLSALHPGAIIVLHDGHDAFAGADRSGTVEATRRVISAARGRGYRFVAVQDLLPGMEIGE